MADDSDKYFMFEHNGERHWHTLEASVEDTIAQLVETHGIACNSRFPLLQQFNLVSSCDSLPEAIIGDSKRLAILTKHCVPAFKGMCAKLQRKAQPRETPPGPATPPESAQSPVARHEGEMDMDRISTRASTSPTRAMTASPTHTSSTEQLERNLIKGKGPQIKQEFVVAIPNSQQMMLNQMSAKLERAAQKNRPVMPGGRRRRRSITPEIPAPSTSAGPKPKSKKPRTSSFVIPISNTPRSRSQTTTPAAPPKTPSKGKARASTPPSSIRRSGRTKCEFTTISSDGRRAFSVRPSISYDPTGTVRSLLDDLAKSNHAPSMTDFVWKLSGSSIEVWRKSDSYVMRREPQLCESFLREFTIKEWRDSRVGDKAKEPFALTMQYRDNCADCSKQGWFKIEEDP